MSVLRSLFGPSREEVWRQLCREIDADYVEGGMFKSDLVQARVGEWIITLDILTESTGKSSTNYTRLRAPYVNPDNLRFTIYRSGLFSELGKWFGMQDIEVGDPRFDGAFVIQGNSESAVAQLFQNERIQTLLEAQPKVRLTVKNDEGWFGPSFPDGVDELYFQALGVIKDVDRLRAMFDLFAEVLNHMCHLGSAYEDDVELVIERLLAPGGRIVGNVVLWDGDPPRRDAVARLARLKDPRAVEPLLSILDDPDVVLAAAAISALGEIGDRAAVAGVLPSLGDVRYADGRALRDLAADTLRRLGEEDRVRAFERALGGDVDPLKAVAGEVRAELAQALINALGDPDAAIVAHAAEASASLGAAEALPRLRAEARRYPRDHATRRACEDAIEELEARAALPRPARSADRGAGTLPRAAAEPAPRADTLPRASEDEAPGGG